MVATQHATPAADPDVTPEALIARFLRVRQATEALAAPLSPEDQQLQSMPSCSPTKWHRAHTTWFFEKFLLAPAGIAPFHEKNDVLWNSYYESITTPRVARDKRGMLSRPTAADVGAFRRAVDGRVVELLRTTRDLARAAFLIDLGLAHEEQHQELLLTDILHAFAENPLLPAYRAPAADLAGGDPAREAPAFVPFEGGVHHIGAGDDGFAFDNERPRHRVLVAPFQLAARPISVGEVRAFIDARGYETPSLWLSDGFDFVRKHGLRAPGHARVDDDGVYRVFTLRGLRAARDDEPASHLSFWEAEAVARFLGARLPTEAEWEIAAAGLAPHAGNFADGELVPAPASSSSAGLAQMFGDVWEWTRSSYDPYPGFAASAGALGEYNGKFMAQQIVLRGGSCFTPRGHMRASYRNFWHPDTRFQMTGARVAKDR